MELLQTDCQNKRERERETERDRERERERQRERETERERERERDAFFLNLGTQVATKTIARCFLIHIIVFSGVMNSLCESEALTVT